uniref:DNK domain-containing protein n=1 Tax=Macrostomum lignano TaxID=282301 RepID=A0A1I8H2Q6_9PLAT
MPLLRISRATEEGDLGFAYLYRQKESKTWRLGLALRSLTLVDDDPKHLPMLAQALRFHIPTTSTPIAATAATEEEESTTTTTLLADENDDKAQLVAAPPNAPPRRLEQQQQQLKDWITVTPVKDLEAAPKPEFVPILANMTSQSRIFLLEGVIGAGKSTLLRELALTSRLEGWADKAVFGPEPVHQYARHPLLPDSVNLLQSFYRGELPAVAFQQHVSHDLLDRDSKRQLDVLEATGVPFTGANTTLIYLRIDPELAIQRIAQRGRSGEETGISLDYLRSLDEAFTRHYQDYSNVHEILIRSDTSTTDLAHLVGGIIRQPVRRLIEEDTPPGWSVQHTESAHRGRANFLTFTPLLDEDDGETEPPSELLPQLQVPLFRLFNSLGSADCLLLVMVSFDANAPAAGRRVLLLSEDVFNQWYSEATNDLVAKLDNFQSRGSNWKFLGVVKVDVMLCIFRRKYLLLQSNTSSRRQQQQDVWGAGGGAAVVLAAGVAAAAAAGAQAGGGPTESAPTIRSVPFRVPLAV